MENASKALLMAGGVLIALMVVGALMLMFSNLSNYQEQSDASTLSSQVAEFNNQFIPYDKDNLTLMELKTLYNKIESNNARNPEEQIDCNIEDIYSDIVLPFNEISEDEKMTRTFRCSEVSYNNASGRIDGMFFEENI